MGRKNAAQHPESDLVEADHVDRIHAQWQKEVPDLDLQGSKILARARRLTLLARPRIEEVFAKHGLDTGEFDVLATLRRSGPPFALRPTELYRAMMISSGGLTDRLIRLEKRGLIDRRASDDDKRSILVELTPVGRRCVEAAFLEDMAVENAIVEKLPSRARAQLVLLLRQLLATLESEI